MITIKNEKQIKKYYVKKNNTYVFEDDVEFLNNINVKASIKAHNIYAWNWNIDALNIEANDICVGNIMALDICANNIKAHNIEGLNIDANNIDYFAVCFAYNRIRCNFIKGIHPNAKHFVLDGKLIFKGDEY